MVNVTLSIPVDIKVRMDQHKHVKWSSAIRAVIEKKLNDFEATEKLANKSRLTTEDVEALSQKVERGMAAHVKHLLN